MGDCCNAIHRGKGALWVEGKDTFVEANMGTLEGVIISNVFVFLGDMRNKCQSVIKSNVLYINVLV